MYCTKKITLMYTALYALLFTVLYTSLLNILHTVLYTMLYSVHCIAEEAVRVVFVKIGKHAYISVL